MFHFGLCQCYGITQLEPGVELEGRGAQKSFFSFRYFQVRPSCPTSQCFLAYQGQKKPHFNSIIRALNYHKYNRVLLIQHDRGITWSFEVGIWSRSFCRTNWWCLYWAGGVGGRRRSPAELKQVFPSPFNQKTWPTAQICPEPRLWNNQASPMCSFLKEVSIHSVSHLSDSS